jgi:hypothetical membrane protein
LLAGLVVGPIFVVTFLVEGMMRDGYEPLRHPVSSLALGPGGWVQVVNFVIAGLLTLAFAVGLRRSLRPGPGSVMAPLLVGIWGVGLLGAGAFVTDPVSGYPIGTPAQPVTASWHGTLHDLAFSLPGFVCFAVAMFVVSYAMFRRRSPVFAVYSGLTGVGFIVFFVLATAGFSQDAGLVSTAGLWQRLTVGIGWLWLALLAARQRRIDRRQ